MNPNFPLDPIVILILLFFIEKKVSALGSFSSIAASYGEKGSVFCQLKSDGSQFPDCYGSNNGLIRKTPSNLPFLGLTAGSGFVCGLLTGLKRPFCWGSSSFVPTSVPLTREKDAGYTQISAGDNHLCGLRKPISKNSNLSSVVDCWGYNMTQSYDLGGEILSITAGSAFNCALFAKNMSVVCWGDEAATRLLGSIPPELKFKKICAGGFHICGILNEFRDPVFCSGKSLEPQLIQNADSDNVVYSAQQTFVRPPEDAMVSVVGGVFSSCGIRSWDGGVVCWGYSEENSTPPPSGVKFNELAAGYYFTCGMISSGKSVCWGVDAPTALRLPVSPLHRKSYPCPPTFYDADNSNETSTVSNICLPCSGICPDDMNQVSECNSTSDRLCGYNCSRCGSNECFTTCSLDEGVSKVGQNFLSVKFPIVIIEICFGLLLFIVVLCVTVYYIRYKLKGFDSSKSDEGTVENQSRRSSPELLIQKAQKFTYEQLEQATDGFNEDSLVGKGSFSCVYKGVLKDSGTPIAVKRAIVSNDSITCSNQFLTELDLLSRLNHAHLLSLLGYCDQGLLLVYEFMSNGSLHQHLHGKNKELKHQLDWVKRVRIAVQASHGIEYLHGYACPPVIHRDIKSSNILIDEEHNARVSDFGLSILGPINGVGPLSELPAGTLGYLDPEYYSLHSLTTKSDVYSFGVLLLEILSGRKAIDMQYELGNIVEWAVPLIKSDNIEEILDPVLKHPLDLEALRRVADVAGRCVRMRGKERPSMDRVTTELQQALVILIGGMWDDGAHILSSEVVLGASRLRMKACMKASQMCIERAQSWTSFSSVGSSIRRVSVSSSRESDVDWKNAERNDGSGRVVEEIEPGSPQEQVHL